MSGTIQTWLFDQSDIWIDMTGTKHELDNITPGYARNILVFLAADAERFRWAYLRQKPLEYEATRIDGPLFNHAVLDQHALHWLLDLPLVQRLMKIIVDYHAR